MTDTTQNVFLKNAQDIMNKDAAMWGPPQEGEIQTAEELLQSFKDDGVIGVVVYYNNDKMAHTEKEKLIKAYRDALDTIGPNGAYVNLFVDDASLEYAVRSISVGEYGYDVISEDEYIRIRSEKGVVVFDDFVIEDEAY